MDDLTHTTTTDHDPVALIAAINALLATDPGCNDYFAVWQHPDGSYDLAWLRGLRTRIIAERGNLRGSSCLDEAMTAHRAAVAEAIPSFCHRAGLPLVGIGSPLCTGRWVRVDLVTAIGAFTYSRDEIHGVALGGVWRQYAPDGSGNDIGHTLLEVMFARAAGSWQRHTAPAQVNLVDRVRLLPPDLEAFDLV